MDESAITARLAEVPQWRRSDDGTAISRRFTLADFAAAMRFVNAVADAAEEMNHHPDIEIRWNAVDLTLSTHAVGRLTDNDFTLAGRIDQLAT